ncbi:MAG: hypothetical protein KKH41_08395 [Candidatus Thermoplasmatota archaeon]|nr:hypothetical protein [Euryarchaeota archaeon]MBU4032094.1 hypothetical protein [Candidatus Thermoplasmatota archaeon]MBU4072283.1 hypothetical protein [Candidatus Thermoplasmatota archaeon]MBU4144326.1 hypothetical protein [Candidatus Thermoplasmatota archaeon]MBU4592584.1 hypothetical protein [Candidatus Thermoplasmatota archaeon]
MRTFERPGPQNTVECLELAAARARELSIGEVIIATNSGDTAMKSLARFQGMKIIAVNHHAGFKEPFKVELSPDVRKKLKSSGVRVVIAAHALSGIERSFRTKYQGIYPMELVADTLRMFGQGTKVCVEIALMAADAGELSGESVMCIGGSGTGADTAIILTPVHQRNFLDMRIHEIVCKPR